MTHGIIRISLATLLSTTLLAHLVSIMGLQWQNKILSSQESVADDQGNGHIHNR